MKIRAFLGTAVVIGVAIPALTYAVGQDYNQGLRQELNQQDVEQMYPRRQKAARVDDGLEVKTVKVQDVQPAAAQPIPGNNVQPIYILQQPPALPQAQVQPVTTVEASAVKE